MNTLTQIRDVVTIAHGLRGCPRIAAGTLLSSRLATLRRHGIRIPEQLAPYLMTT